MIVRGIPPAAASIPSPGLYWLQIAEARWVWQPSEPGGSYHAWDGAEIRWALGEVDDDGWYQLIGSDESYEWNEGTRVVVDVRMAEAPPEWIQNT